MATREPKEEQTVENPKGGKPGEESEVKQVKLQNLKPQNIKKEQKKPDINNLNMKLT